MNEDVYRTIAAPAEGIYTEKRSKFIAIALPVRTVDEVKALLEEYQKKYPDAGVEAVIVRYCVESSYFTE